MKGLTILLLAGVLFSCNKHAGHEEQSTVSGLHLNNGKKWIANHETHVGMRNLDSLVKHKDQMKLIDKMKTETSFIVNNCDMRGEDHEQLHLVLVPIIQTLDSLERDIDVEKKQMHFSRIQQHLSSYFEHFEPAQ